MKVDSDLRAAIRAAEKAQPEITWETREKAEREAIQDLFNRIPKHKRKAQALVNSINRHRKELDSCHSKLRDLFGIQLHDGKLQLHRREEYLSNFEKAGGNLKFNEPKRRWRSESIIAELAAAKPAEAKAILKRIGIIWE